MKKKFKIFIVSAILVFMVLTVLEYAAGAINFQYDTNGQIALNTFRNSTAAGKWSQISKSAVIADINYRLAYPSTVYQGRSSLCGPIAIVYELIKRNQSRYVKIMQSLYENGYFYSNNKYYDASAKLRGSRIYEGMTAADWMLAGTLRECANEFFDLDADSGDFVTGLTTPAEMVDWTKNILLFTNVSDESCTLWGEYDVIRHVNSAYGAGGVGFLMVDASEYFGDKSTWWGYPNHWIAFTGNLKIADESWWEMDAEHVDFDCYTWGAIEHVSVSEQRFEAGMFWGVYARTPHLAYAGHVQSIGWQNAVTSPNYAGTVGQALRMEALKVRLNNCPSNWSLSATAQVQGIGWQGTVTGGNNSDLMIGTTGSGLRMEAVKLTLNNAPGYSVLYRTHLSGLGWQAWVRDGYISGTIGQSRAIEAIEIRLEPVEMVNSNFMATINGSNTSTRTISAGTPVLLGGNCAYTKNYFVSALQSDAYWNGIGAEAYEWLSADGNSEILNNVFDVRAFCARKNFALTPGKYYRVKLATGTTWKEQTILIYIQ